MMGKSGNQHNFKKAKRKSLTRNLGEMIDYHAGPSRTGSKMDDWLQFDSPMIWLPPSNGFKKYKNLIE